MPLTPAQVEEIERELTPETPHDVPSVPLFHYTDAEGFEGIVRTGSLWATHYGFLNDTEELLIGERVVLDVASGLVTLATGLQERFLAKFYEDYKQESLSKIAHVCVASFSADNGDSLSQWRAYAAGGGGYSIGISKFRLPDANTPAPDAVMGLWLMQCVYDERLIEAEARQMLATLALAFEDKIRAHRGDPQAQDQIAGIILAVAMRRSAIVALRLKHHAFREEHEWRLIAFPHEGVGVVKFRASARGLVPYVIVDQCLPPGDKLALSHVVVGPTQDRGHGRAAAILFLSQLGYPGSELVVNSIVPFRGTP